MSESEAQKEAVAWQKAWRLVSVERDSAIDRANRAEADCMHWAKDYQESNVRIAVLRAALISARQLLCDADKDTNIDIEDSVFDAIDAAIAA